MSNNLQVVSSARKLVFLVPNTDVVASFPEGAVVSKYGKGNENPAIVVHNATDIDGGKTPEGTWQGAESGHYVIVNEVEEEAALQALSHFRNAPTVGCLETALEELAESGFKDQYTTDFAFIQGKMSPAGECIGLEVCCVTGKILALKAGVVKRDDRDVMTVTKQEDGQFLIHHGDKEPKRIEADILVRTYRNVNGSQINLASIA